MSTKLKILRRSIALENYFRRYCQGRSPLLRDSELKLPVHERLGVLPSSKRNTKQYRRKSCLQKSKYHEMNAQERFESVSEKEVSTDVVDASNEMSFKMNVWNDQISPDPSNYPRFKMHLNSMIQSFIKKIQDASPRAIFHGLYPIIPVATSISLNQRFSNLL